MSSQHERCTRPGRLTPFICAVDFHTSEGDLFGRPRRTARRFGQIISAYLNSDFIYLLLFFSSTAAVPEAVSSSKCVRQHQRGQASFLKWLHVFSARLHSNVSKVCRTSKRMESIFVCFLCAGAFFIFFMTSTYGAPERPRRKLLFQRWEIFFCLPLQIFSIPSQ